MWEPPSVYDLSLQTRRNTHTSARFRRPVRPLSPEELERRVQMARSYLSGGNMSLETVLRRRPDKDCADVTSVRCCPAKRLWCMPSAVKDDAHRAELLGLAKDVRDQKWNRIVDTLTSSSVVDCIHAVFAYLAAHKRPDIGLDRVSWWLSEANVDAYDVPHLYHFIDECMYMTSETAGGCLVLLMGYEPFTQLRDVGDTVQRLPTFGSSSRRRMWRCGDMPRGPRVPKLVPTGEGYDLVDVDTDETLDQLIRDKKFHVAVSKATNMLDGGHDDGHVLIQRATALMMMNKEADALADVERAIELGDNHGPSVDPLRLELQRRMGVKLTPPTRTHRQRANVPNPMSLLDCSRPQRGRMGTG